MNATPTGQVIELPRPRTPRMSRIVIAYDPKDRTAWGWGYDEAEARTVAVESAERMDADATPEELEGEETPEEMALSLATMELLVREDRLTDLLDMLALFVLPEPSPGIGLRAV